jgi:hypothetical protein
MALYLSAAGVVLVIVVLFLSLAARKSTPGLDGDRFSNARRITSGWADEAADKPTGRPTERPIHRSIDLTSDRPIEVEQRVPDDGA